MSQTCWCVFDIEGKIQELAALEQRIALPDFWEHPQEAQVVMRSMARLQESVATWSNVQKSISYLIELVELAREEEDFSLQESFYEELGAIESHLKALEFELLLQSDRPSGDHHRSGPPVLAGV